MGKNGGSQREDYLPCLGGLCHGGGFLPFPRYHFKPSLIEANFGVIDAQGAAAMFEVDYYKYTMYDANNPKDAPYGYIARTNFSFAGEANRGQVMYAIWRQTGY